MRLLCCGLLLSVASAPAQQREPGTLHLVDEVRLVLLDVAVRDAQGRSVSGLARRAFRVFDSGREQRVAAFAQEDTPVRVGLVVDASASMRARRSDVVTAVRAFARESNPADELFAVLFNDEVLPARPSEPEAIAAEVGRVAMEGRTALFDAIDAGLRALDKPGGPDRKALVVVSDGGDNASRLARSAILRAVNSSHATIYAVGIADASQAGSDAGFLRELARTSGGGVHIGLPAQDLPEICRQIAREIRSRYTVGFHAAAAPRPQSRTLRVRAWNTAGGELRVLCRRSYLATP